jgi:hypothetical protein
MVVQGANAQFDFFYGQGNSVVNATNVVRNRRSCTDTHTAGKLVARTKRAARFPGLTNEQVYEVADLTWRGQLFPQTLHLQNYSVEFPRHYNGGYLVVSVAVQTARSSARHTKNPMFTAAWAPHLVVSHAAPGVRGAWVQQQQQ